MRLASRWRHGLSQSGLRLVYCVRTRRCMGRSTNAARHAARVSGCLLVGRPAQRAVAVGSPALSSPSATSRQDGLQRRLEVAMLAVLGGPAVLRWFDTHARIAGRVPDGRPAPCRLVLFCAPCWLPLAIRAVTRGRLGVGWERQHWLGCGSRRRACRTRPVTLPVFGLCRRPTRMSSRARRGGGRRADGFRRSRRRRRAVRSPGPSRGAPTASRTRGTAAG